MLSSAFMIFIMQFVLLLAVLAFLMLLATFV